MSGYTNTAADAIILKAAGIAGVRSTYARSPDAISAAPAFVLGTHAAVYTPGEREVVVYTFPLKLYVERTTDDPRTIAITNDLIDLTIQAYSQGITLQGASTTMCVLRGWDSNLWLQLNEEGPTYQVTEFTVELTVTRARPFSA